MQPPLRLDGRVARRIPLLRTTRFALAAALVCGSVVAQTVVDAIWVGVSGVGNTDVPGNWGLAVVPSNGNSGLHYSWIIDGNTLLTSIATVNAAASIRDLMISAGDELRLANAVTLTLVGTDGVGTINNAGTIVMEGGATNFVVNGGTFTFSGAGSMRLSNSANNRIYGSLGTETLKNAIDHTIQGGGQLGVNLLSIVNEGSIIANQATSLVIDPNAGGITNTGTLRATNNATLLLQNGSVTNTYGTIKADTGSQVTLSAMTITGGTLRSDGTGKIRGADSSTLANVRIATGSKVEIANADRLNLSGTIENNGTIAMLGGGNLTDLVINTGGATLTGGGVIEMSNSLNNQIYGTTAATTLNNVDNTIRGAGKLGLNQLALTNTGTIEANQSNSLTVDLNNSAPFTNEGTLRATSGGNLIFADALTNAGAVVVGSGSTFTTQGAFTQTAGFTALGGGTFSATSTTLQGNSVLFGYGTISGAVTSNGVIAPGLSASGPGIGELTFNHTLTLQSNSLLHFELGGPTSFDKIQASAVTFGGGLMISFINGFETSVLADHTFTVLSTTNATGLGGTFLGLPNGSRLPTFDGFGSFKITYGANSLTLSEFVPVPEPSTYLLIGVGAVMVWLVSRRRTLRRRHQS